MRYAITPRDLNVFGLLSLRNAPSGFSKGDMAHAPFAAYANVPRPLRCARMRFLTNGKANHGITILVYDPKKIDCELAFRQYKEGNRLLNSVAVVRDCPIVVSFKPHDHKGFVFAALARTKNVVVSMGAGASHCAPDQEASLRAYFDCVMNDLYEYSTHPKKLEARLAQVKAQTMASLNTRIAPIIQPHLATLATKITQKVQRDDYGNEDYSQSTKEIDYFINRVVKPRVSIPANELHLLRETIGDHLLRYTSSSLATLNPVNVEILNPLEFEQYCAEILQTHGWSSRLTRTSGDQGVDIVATKADRRVVLQCKKVSQPVGNAAVQEIIAGRVFERAHVGVVVTNSCYTQSAKQLAAAANVLLLHYRDLAFLSDRLDNTGT